MEKEENLELQIKSIAKKFLDKAKEKEIKILSHFDTDGITSASIIIKALKKLDIKFSIKILKRLEENSIKELPQDSVILFLDLGSGSLKEIQERNFQDVFIIDHHEITQEIPEGINIINPELYDKQKISSSGLTYLFAKEIDPLNKELAKLAILGMIGDCLEKEIEKLNHNILNDGEVQKKRGLLIYPSTRPLNRTLEFSSNPFIPGVTGNVKGVLELLREVGLNPNKKGYPSLIELSEEEMARLVTAIMLRNPKANNNEIIGDIFLIKMFNKLEDARELSAKINACSRLGESDTAIQLCMEIPKAVKKAETIHVRYKQKIVSGLKFVTDNENIQGKGYVLINAKDEIEDTVIGTIISIISNSLLYEEGTVIIGMAYYDNKIKVSARNVGNQGRNVREILSNAMDTMGGEVGGHEFAAGCMIHQEKEDEFIDNLKRHLEIELVKI
jgi:single-stranded-DNA-specific exonuclease